MTAGGPIGPGAGRRGTGTPPPDRIAGRFELVRLARTGGMGAIYRAIDHKTGAIVALKLLKDAGSAAAARLRAEAEALASLDHPGIVRHIAHGPTPDGGEFLAMEWLEGEDLSERLQREGLTMAETALLGARVAAALHDAHERGIVHRDVKPQNLFLPGGALAAVKVLDFGVARFGERRETRPGSSVGTPGYMAPEQARADAAVNRRADLFALGCVLYECATGRPAFIAESELALLAKILLEEPPRVRDLRPDLPETLVALIERLLDKDPEARPADALEVARVLAPLAARVTDSPTRAVLTGHERRLLCVIAVGAPGRRARGPADALPNLGACAGIARAYGGTLVPLAGDQAVVTLVVPGTAADQAMQAARLALALRGAAPGAPMALATGRGDVAGPSPVGEVIERAAALADRAAEIGRGVLLDEATAGLLDGRFVVEQGDEEGGGAAAGDLILTGERRDDDEPRTLLGKPTPFVGREVELASLEAAHQASLEVPEARVVLVTAPPGAGKTRLRTEFLERLVKRVPGARVWVGRGDPMRRGSPYALLGHALRRAFGLLPGDPAPQARRKLLAHLALEIAPSELTRVAEFLGEVVGVPAAESPSPMLQAARREAIIMADQIARAFEEFLLAASQKGPIVLGLEDLQWGDAPSVAFIDQALRRLADRPLFVLALGRPEVHDQFGDPFRERGRTDLRLPELSPRAAGKLVALALGDGTAAHVVDRLVQRAAGNAFWLEELVRAEAQGKADAPPGTVLALAQSRLERLAEPARRALRAASVVGPSFWIGGVAALIGEELTDGLASVLDALVAEEVLVRRSTSRFPSETEYGFRHALVRDAAYGMLTDDDRVLGHRLAYAWLVAIGEREALVLAEHAERGGLAGDAIDAWLRAAEEALSGSDLGAVLTRAERGITLGASGERLGALRLLQAKAHRWRSEQAQAETRGLEAMRCLASGSARWFDAAGEVAVASGLLGRLDHLVDLGEALLAAPDQVAGGASLIACARAATFFFLHGQQDLGEAVLERIEAVEARLGTLEPDVRGRVCYVRATHALITGDLGGYLQRSEEAALCFETSGNVRSLAVQRQNIGNAHLLTGGWAEAAIALRAALALAERTGSQSLLAETRQGLAAALAEQGDYERALAVGTAGAEAAARVGARRAEAQARSVIARVAQRAGDLERADLEIRAALRVAEGLPAVRAWTLAVAAEIALASGEPRIALGHAESGLTILRELGALEVGEALLRLTWAQALAAVPGREEDARFANDEAKTWLEARAQRIKDPALRERFRREVPENARIAGL